MVIILLTAFTIAFSAVPERMTKAEKLQWAIDVTSEYCRNIVPKETSYGGIGLFTTKDVKFKQEYCEVPWKYIMNSYDEYVWTEYFKDTPTRTRLVARLIYEKFINPDTDDFRWKYVNAQSEELHSVLNYTSTEVENLRKWSGDPSLM